MSKMLRRSHAICPLVFQGDQLSDDLYPGLKHAANDARLNSVPLALCLHRHVL